MPHLQSSVRVVLDFRKRTNLREGLSSCTYGNDTMDYQRRTKFQNDESHDKSSGHDRKR